MKKENNFKTADKLEKSRPKYKGHMLYILKSRLGNNLIVICPKCGHKQHTQTTLQKKCIACHSTFAIYPKNKPSRVYYCPPELKPILFQLYYLEHEGKFYTIL